MVLASTLLVFHSFTFLPPPDNKFMLPFLTSSLAVNPVSRVSAGSVWGYSISNISITAPQLPLFPSPPLPPHVCNYFRWPIVHGALGFCSLALGVGNHLLTCITGSDLWQFYFSSFLQLNLCHVKLFITFDFHRQVLAYQFVQGYN